MNGLTNVTMNCLEGYGESVYGIEFGIRNIQKAQYNLSKS